MANPLLSEALKEAYLEYGPNADVVETLEISTSTASLFYCTGFDSFTATTEDSVSRTFVPAPFKFTLPAQDTTGARTLNIAIENVDGSVIAFINSARASGSVITVKYRTFLASDTSAPQNPRPLKLSLKSAKATLSGVQFEAAVVDMVNRSFPNAFYTYSRFPGLRQ